MFAAATSPITRQTVGKSFIVAISILGIGALLQLGAVGWTFYSRFRTTPLPPEPLSDAGAGGRNFNDPFADEEAAIPSGNLGNSSPTVSPSAPTITVMPSKPAPGNQFAFKPIPINPTPPAASTQAQPESRFTELIDQARMLRERGDTSTAVTRFREALALDPESPLAIAEIANTYEKMGAADKAAEQWRRIYDMGQSAGVYYTAAEAKMKASQAQAILQAMPSAAPSPQDLALVAEATRSATAATAAATPENVGMFPGSKLGLGDITTKDEQDPTSVRKVVVRVPVRAKPRARIDVSDVTIQVIFYDVLNGRTLEKTNAQVSTRWASPPPDWSDDDVEILEVIYQQLPPEQGEPAENRKLYGYLARVYYKDALQDARAEPTRLGQTFPAPRMLQPDSAP